MADKSAAAVRAAIKRATLAAQKAVESLDSDTLDELQAIYKRAAQEIAARIADYAGPDGNLTLQELQNVLAQVNAHLRELGHARDAMLDGSLAKAADLGVKPYAEEAIAGAAAEAASSMRVSSEALNFVRNFVAADGLQLSDRVWRLDRHARDLVVNEIEQSVIQGHGAAQAAREFLSRGAAVPGDVSAKIGASNAGAIGRRVGARLLRDTGSPLDNAMRLFRTEINRAHGEAYMMGGENHPDFGGWKFMLSPQHPKPDICDLLSRQNLHGLGPGVYPSRARCPWPAHPNTLSFVEIVFKDEVTAEHKAGKETPLQALERLSPSQQIGVLGKEKQAIFKDGKLTQGMIRTPLATVKKRISKLDE